MGRTLVIPDRRQNGYLFASRGYAARARRLYLLVNTPKEQVCCKTWWWIHGMLSGRVRGDEKVQATLRVSSDRPHRFGGGGRSAPLRWPSISISTQQIRLALLK